MKMIWLSIIQNKILEILIKNNFVYFFKILNNLNKYFNKLNGNAFFKINNNRYQINQTLILSF